MGLLIPFTQCGGIFRVLISFTQIDVSVHEPARLRVLALLAALGQYKRAMGEILAVLPD